MTFYGMHDAPGTKQKNNTFKNENGRPLEPGEEKKFLTPWSFMNPFLEALMIKEGFITDGEPTQDPDYVKLIEILKSNIKYLKSNPVLEEWLHPNTEAHIITSKNKLSQAYKAISMKKGDYVYIRGKTGKLDEGWIFKVVNNQIDYVFGDGLYWPMMKLETVCKVPNDTYLKIHAQRASFWTIINPEVLATLSALV